MKKHGFTLAETLITLTIIGVVAALTIPTLMQKTQDRELISMWKKKASEIISIYGYVKNEMGGIGICVSSKDYATAIDCNRANGYIKLNSTLSPEFVEKFVSHLKVVDSCGLPQYGETNECRNYYFKWYGGCSTHVSYYGSLKEGKGQIGKDTPASCNEPAGLYTAWDFSNKAVLLKDGSVIHFGGLSSGIISVDVNGFGKGPNIVGRDMFALIVNEDWVKPIGAEGTFYPYHNGGTTCKCSKDAGSERAQGFLGSTDLTNGEVLSGSCCSAALLYK